jgi:hypothetical protein
VPAEGQGSDDQRALGVQVRQLSITADGEPLALAGPNPIPPLPVSSAEPWSRAAFGWFYDPRYPHLVDMWPWYVTKSGLPAQLAWLALIPAVGLIATGTALVRQLRAAFRTA